jgi:hypothetical protein
MALDAAISPATTPGADGPTGGRAGRSCGFASGFVREALYFSDPAHQQQDLALWMSPRYVGKSWDLPPDVIVRTMELAPDNAQPTLREVTADLGISLDELQTRIEAAKAEEETRRAVQHGGDKGEGDRND